MFVTDNEAYIDWWLLQKFQGKTLEELDAIDWPRLQRAMEVDRIVEAEQRRKLVLDGKIEQKDVAPSEWQMWAHHQRIIGEDGY